MNKKYLPLYLGCEVIGTYNDQSGSKGYLTGVTNGGEECEIQFFLEDGVNVSEEPEFSPATETKLILRPISDMTDEERKELWRMIFSEGNHFNESALNYRGRTLWFDKKERNSEPRWVMMQGVERLGIEMNGHVWADCDLQHWKHNQHEVTLWLLGKGFDLFNLIGRKMAIDKTQIPAT